jgi:hypothetical protein
MVQEGEMGWNGYQYPLRETIRNGGADGARAIGGNGEGHVSWRFSALAVLSNPSTSPDQANGTSRKSIHLPDAL